MTRVLVVDDDPDIREILALVLEVHGITAIEAGSGMEALARLRAAGHVDLVLLDLMMPGMNGAEVLATMKIDPALADIPVVIVSGDASAAEVGRRLAAAGCLMKPIDAERLLREIRRHVDLPPTARSSAPP